MFICDVAYRMRPLSLEWSRDCLVNEKSIFCQSISLIVRIIHNLSKKKKKKTN